ncbi:MAG: hypothetical protein P8X42_02165 [Calditrichaceae bacterium]|jgi:uncharacterized repeat protein (TIGR04076 family)
MNLRNTAWNVIKWKFMKDRLGYSDDEMKLFRSNPRNEAVLSKAPELANKTIIAEVVQSEGCNSQHLVGDKFYFDGAGNLITKLCPKRICIYALHSIAMQVFAAGELICAGINANDMKFKHAGCFDVGLECGGWGHISMKIYVQDRQ